MSRGTIASSVNTASGSFTNHIDRVSVLAVDVASLHFLEVQETGVHLGGDEDLILRSTLRPWTTDWLL